MLRDVFEDERGREWRNRGRGVVHHVEDGVTEVRTTKRAKCKRVRPRSGCTFDGDFRVVGRVWERAC